VQHLIRIFLLTLALTLAVSSMPASALAGDVVLSAPDSSAPAGKPVLEVLRDRLFVLEHQLHALEAELMALRERLTALETGSDA